MRNFVTFALLLIVATTVVPMRSARNVDTALTEERNSVEWDEYTEAKEAKGRNADTTLTEDLDSTERNNYVEPKKSKYRDVDSVSGSVNSFAFSNRQSDPTIEQRWPPHFDKIGATKPCPNLYNLVGAYCIDKETIEREYLAIDGIVYFYDHVKCLPSTYCQGSAINSPEPRSARCVLNIKRGLLWVTNKAIGSGISQCKTFEGKGVTSAEGLGAQVGAPAPNTDPPMPQEAQLFYQGASYPIQAIDQSSMDKLSGYLIFNNVIDYTQVLQFCVNVASTAIVFNIGLINPVPADMGDLTFITQNKTIYRRFDNITNIWKKVQLNIEE